MSTLLRQPKFWLLGLLSSLYIIYLTLVWRVENPSHFGISILFGFAVFLLLQDKQHQLKFGSSIGASLVGSFGVLGFLWGSVTYTESPLLRLLPFVVGIGVGLLASGFKGLQQYYKELTLLFFMGGPSAIASLWFDISPLSASFTRVLLFYTGFEVSGQGLIVSLPTGGIKVGYDCSGIDQINYLFGLSVLCLIMFPIRGRLNQILVLFIGLNLGFLINAIRLAILTVLIASNRDSFNRLHTGEGSYIFAILEVLLLGIFYLWIFRRQDKLETHSWIP